MYVYYSNMYIYIYTRYIPPKLSCNFSNTSRFRLWTIFQPTLRVFIQVFNEIIPCWVGFPSKYHLISRQYFHNWLYLGLSPCPVTVTTRITTFLVGNPEKNPSFATVTGRGDNPRYNCVNPSTVQQNHNLFYDSFPELPNIISFLAKMHELQTSEETHLDAELWNICIYIYVCLAEYFRAWKPWLGMAYISIYRNVPPPNNSTHTWIFQGVLNGW